VQVGFIQNLEFAPNQLQATIGDIVQFTFQLSGHQVIQSYYNNSCSPIQDTLDQEGFQSEQYVIFDGAHISILRDTLQTDILSMGWISHL
jgi:plastocyanin